MATFIRLTKSFLYIITIAIFIRIFFFEIYLVPSASMAKTILPGEILFVNKAIYGARLSVNSKNGNVLRIPGLSQIQRNDVVVFNYPGADTIYKNRTDLDYYGNIIRHGHDRALKDTMKYGQLDYLPIKLRQPYVKRCIGLPGDTLQILNNIVFVNNKVSKCQIKKLTSLKDSIKAPDLFKYLKVSCIPPKKEIRDFHFHFPHYIKELWCDSSYGPLYVPKKGDTITLDYDNLSIYNRIITVYEYNKLDTLSREIYINGKLTNTYVIKQNYYYMMGDNYWKSIDSRFWGFVPEDHIIGKAVCVVWSWNKNKPDYHKLRVKRLLKGLSCSGMD